MKRALPKHTILYLELAKTLKLSCPLGRALYISNRIQNGDWWYYYHAPASEVFLAPNTEGVRLGQENYEHMIRRMKAIRPTTAQRWLKHWKSGGSIKMITMSQKEHNQRTRQYRAGQDIYGFRKGYRF